LAACVALDTIAFNCDVTNTVTICRLSQVHDPPPPWPQQGLTPIRVFRSPGPWLVGPDPWPADRTEFKFVAGGGTSGRMVFTEGTEGATADTKPLLLVTDAGHDSVHVLDVVTGRALGFVGGAGGLPGPRGVATSGDKVAISCWKTWRTCLSEDNVIALFEGSHATGWVRTATLNCGRSNPVGLRFSTDGTGVVFADGGFHRVTRVNAEGSIAHLATDLGEVRDVEHVEGSGWLVGRTRRNIVTLVDTDATDLLGDLCNPAALAYIRGLGLFVREGDVSGAVSLFVVPA